ncbi:MAG: agmatine deiminase family protein [Sporolactobacillus sp.]
MDTLILLSERKGWNEPMNSAWPDRRMPAEWDTHERTLVSWPVRRSMCDPDNYETVCAGYEQLVRTIAAFEAVTLFVNREDEAMLSRRFSDWDAIDICVIAHDDSWVRDNGPTFVAADGALAGINWRFNAWGEKYTPYDRDDRLAADYLAQRGIRRIDVPLVLEGGSIHTDGCGTLLTTEQCLLNPNRNPELSRHEIETVLKRQLGVRHIIWLKDGLPGDETDGHVDNLACFAAPAKVLMQVCSDADDEGAEASRVNLEVLASAHDADGRIIEVEPIQQPPARFYQGRRLTLSYLNFYFVNGGLIVPVFGGDAARTDQLALEALHRVFPDRRIQPIDGMALVTEGGNVHCATQQIPQINKEAHI